MRAKSEENWSVGRQCLDVGSLNAAASRLYYAVFQAVLEFALVRKGYQYKGYGVHADMARLVRSEGKGRAHYGEVFEGLMGLRITADYEPETPPKTEIEALLKDADRIRVHYLKKAY